MLAVKVEVLFAVTFVIAGQISTHIAALTVAAAAVTGAFAVVASHRDLVS